METWLEDLLDMGLSEAEFWDMTLAEINRFADSYRRVQKRQAQEKAYADYHLADLIGYSIARIYSSEAKYPEIYEVYPAIFDKKAIEEAKAKENEKQLKVWLQGLAESSNKTREGGQR